MVCARWDEVSLGVPVQVRAGVFWSKRRTADRVVRVAGPVRAPARAG